MKTRFGYEPDPEKWQDNQEDRAKNMVWYEWLHVCRGEQRVPHRVCIMAGNAINGDRQVPHDPLGKSSPLNLYFTLEYMQAFAESICNGCEYLGISFESDRPSFELQVPDGGLDIQLIPVYWNFPAGSVCSSLRDLNDSPSQVLECISERPYAQIAKEMGWDVLGVCADDASLQHYLSEPGTLEDKRWRDLVWSEPDSEKIPCWWLVNSGQIS